MIENYNASVNPDEIIDYKKFIGVGKVNILSVNPSNEILRSVGWNIPENADEPQYVKTKDVDGKTQTYARVRFLVQVQDMEEKPIVPMDFWVRPEVFINSEQTKCKIIDSFGRTAWGSKDEVKGHKIPQYKNGPANIASDYKVCHRGEEEIVRFLFKYLNITPLQVFSRAANDYVESKNPGKLTIDKWSSLCTGDVSEIKEYVKLQPENCVGVVFGIKTTDDNKTYQTFLNTYYLGNAAKTDLNGEYPAARRAIDKYMEDGRHSDEIYSAKPITEWTTTATQAISDNSEDASPLFDESGNFVIGADDDDLPL